MPGLEPFITFGVTVLQDIVTAAYGFLPKEQQEPERRQQATRAYVQGMLERYGKVKVLGQREPVELIQLYVRANIIEKITARMGADIHDLQEFFDLQKRRFYKKLETTDAEAIANKLDKFIVLGKPGAGKTTFLRYLALAMLRQQSGIRTRRLPIFVTLRDWADEKNALLDYIARQFEACGYPQAGRFVEQALQQGRCLLLFDGLDEISQEAKLDDIIREIRDFSDQYRDNQLVISCRVAAYNHWFEQYSDVEMADFNDEQIATFVNNWFAAEPMTGTACLARLNSSEQLKELATIPLLLTLMCITYEEDNDFPRSRADLYERAIDALLTKWDSSRRIRRRDPYEQLSTRHKKNLFAQIAFETFLNDQYFIRERELVRMIEGFIINMADFDQQQLTVESKEVLKSIEAQHGIFVERARKIYSFGHLTFQEYFTAKYLADLDVAELSEQLIDRHLHNEKWREVFLLAVGMLPRADGMLRQMCRRNRRLLTDEVLDQLLQKNQALLVSQYSKHPKVLREATGLHILLIFILARAPKLTARLARTPDLARDLARHLDTAEVQTRAQVLARAQALNLDLDLARDLTRALVRDLSQNLNVIPLQRFLTGSILIIHCLQTDCYVSKEVRQEILDTLLKPLTEAERRELGMEG